MTEKDKEKESQRELTPQELKKIEAEADVALADVDLKKAEAARARAEERKELANARFAEATATMGELNVERELIKRERERHADGWKDRTYRYLTDVSDSSALKCIDQLYAWHREDPKCDITLIFDSPGGDVTAGLHLFDELRHLSKMGHKITTNTRGMAASMAGILLQAGDVRMMGPESFILIHEVSFGASGSVGEVDDRVKWIKMIQNRVLDIFAARCQGADRKVATKALNKSQLKKGWSRKDWWIDSKEALAFGLVDEIG